MPGGDNGDMDGEAFVVPGGSSARFEPPDLCLGTFVGEVSPEEMTALFGELERLSRGRSHVFTLGDLTRCGPLSAATRKAAAEGGKGMIVRGAAIFGASFAMRMFATLMAKTFDFINATSDKHVPMRFFNTEAEARAWLAERRKIVAQERG